MRRKRSQHAPLAIEDYQRAFAQAGFFDNAWMRVWLIDRVAEAHGQQALARLLKTPQVAISDAIVGRRRVSAALARALGFQRTDRRVLRYQSLRPESAARVEMAAQILGVPVNAIFDGRIMTLTPEQMKAVVAHEVDRAGSQYALSRLAKVPRWRVAEVISGLRPPSSQLAVAFGFYRDSRVSVEYRPSHSADQPTQPTVAANAVPAAPAA
ncbi:MAG: hypothetical protein WBC51_04950 [Vicinamibacterales bacterium]